jgi:hypothetical protein
MTGFQLLREEEHARADNTERDHERVNFGGTKQGPVRSLRSGLPSI